MSRLTARALPPLKVGQVWQCSHQSYSVKIIEEVTTGVFRIGIRTKLNTDFSSAANYLAGRLLDDGSGWGWTDRTFHRSFEMTNLLFDPGWG